MDQPHLPYHDVRSLEPDRDENTSGGPGCWSVGLYALFFGWWLSLLATIYAWVLLVSVFGSARGMMVLGSLCWLAFRRNLTQGFRSAIDDVELAIENQSHNQRPFVLRIAYAIFFGWWLSLLTLLVAWLLLMSVVGIPTAHRIYANAPRLATLAVYEVPKSD